MPSYFTRQMMQEIYNEEIDDQELDYWAWRDELDSNKILAANGAFDPTDDIQY